MCIASIAIFDDIYQRWNLLKRNICTIFFKRKQRFHLTSYTGLVILINVLNTELWCSGLTCLPVTQENAGSTPVSSAIFFATVAQLVEQRTENPRVVGSIPTRGTSYRSDPARICGFFVFVGKL